MSCSGSWGHLFVYTILHKQCAVNHLRCRRGDADLHHNGGGSARIKRRGQMPFHFALAFQSVLMPAIFFSLPPPRHRCRCLVLCCTCSSSPAPACQPWKKKNSTMSWEGEKKILHHQRRKRARSKTISIPPQFSLNSCPQSTSSPSGIKRIPLHISYFLLARLPLMAFQQL